MVPHCQCWSAALVPLVCQSVACRATGSTGQHGPLDKPWALMPCGLALPRVAEEGSGGGRCGFCGPI